MYVSLISGLVVLNISHNDLSEVTPQRFSPFCSLKIIDVNGTSMQPCTCQTVAMYLKRRGLSIKNGITCDGSSDDGRGRIFFIDSNTKQSIALIKFISFICCCCLIAVYCGDFTSSLNESLQYFECLQNVREIRMSAESRRTWLSIVCGLFAFFVIFMGKFLLHLFRPNRPLTQFALDTKYHCRHVVHIPSAECPPNQAIFGPNQIEGGPQHGDWKNRNITKRSQYITIAVMSTTNAHEFVTGNGMR